MEDTLRKLQIWASHGTIRQFYTEVSAKISPLGYEAEMTGDTVTCYRVRKEGGFLGIGARKVREPVFKVTRTDSEIVIDESSLDKEFVTLLAGMLAQH
ncbi:MAG: hypothetical protein FJZ90_04215 [Chloroflexi bacterium]|nr:hypothetical protein [Chloroflexota bacterium]